MSGATVTGLNGTQIPAAGATFTPMSGPGGMYGGRRGGLKAKTMRRMLKKAGLKTTGKKATLTRRMKKAHLRGGSLAGGIVGNMELAAAVGGRHRRRRSHRGGELNFGDAGGTFPFKTGDVGTGGRRRRRRRGGMESESDEGETKV